MAILKTHYGRPSYTVKNEKVEVYITVEGGHLTADFNVGTRTINPYFIAPWWEEAPYQKEDKIIQVLRGDFFCMPFGGNDDEYNGKKYPVHGETSNNNWELVDVNKSSGKVGLDLKTELSLDNGEVFKTIELYDNHPVIYSTHRFSKVRGSFPVGHHPTLKFPEKEGVAYIDISKPITGFTTPVPFEEAKNKGYSRLKLNTEILDRSKVPTLDGGSLDLSRYPTSFGYEDLVVFINDQSRDFCFSAASVPSEGYLYFQLKNPKVLAETLFWMSNGGRHYSPWNGRVRGVLGIEEITAYYHYGIKPSIDNNEFQKRGFKSYLDIDENCEIRIIMGVVPIDSDFKGVEDIVKKNQDTITIKGKNGEAIDVPCFVDFLGN